MNVVCITGRMTREPEVRYSQSGTAFASFTLAVDRRFKREGEPSADFPNCTAFGKTAEFLEKYFSKGMKAEVVGRIQTRSYDGKNGKVYVTEIVAEQVNFAESKGDSAPKSNTAKPQNDPLDGFMDILDEIGDEELPFG
jgi:single-strand DNA-binding protein